LATQHQTPFNNIDIQFPEGFGVSFDEEAFDSFIKDQGVLLEHFSAQACPVGMISEDDATRRPHDDHEGCSNGFIYIREGTCFCLFNSNTLSKNRQDMGILDDAQVNITLPRMYEPECGMTKPVLVAPFDRFYIKEDAGLEVVHWQRHTAHITGLDRLAFPVKKVLNVIDSTGKRYTSEDYCISPEGHLQWVNGGPGFDPKLNKGLIYTIRFTYRPYFYVTRMPHEIRVAQVQDDITGERGLKRMPQSAVLTREYNFMSQGSESVTSSADARQPRSPASAPVLGPR